MRTADEDALGYALSVARLLWPEPAGARFTRRPDATDGEVVLRDWLLLPNPARPTLLVPTGLPAAARMLRRHGDRLAPRAARVSMAWSVRTGLLERAPATRLRVSAPDATAADGPSVERSLAGVLPDMRATGVLLGTPRANRKPVLQVFGQDGRTVAFVKVGVDDLTRGLVRTEAANLTSVHAAGLRTIEAPEVLHLGSFGELELLALSPLESSQERRAASLPYEAMAELSTVAGVRECALADSGFWHRLVGAAATLPASDQANHLQRLLDRAQARWGTRELTFGSWHGDWAPWNMGLRDGRIQLWDWERFGGDVPLGFDAIHFRAQRVRHATSHTQQSERALLGDLPALLAAVAAPSEGDQPTVHLVLYLLEISNRYLQMAGAKPGGPSHARAGWALDLADRLTG